MASKLQTSDQGVAAKFYLFGQIQTKQEVSHKVILPPYGDCSLLKAFRTWLFETM